MTNAVDKSPAYARLLAVAPAGDLSTAPTPPGGTRSVDEVQDNSESQSAFLDRLFCPAQNRVRRQRFGDSNQTIYQDAEEDGAETDPFPGSPKADLPHSFRFGQVIANFANPLGVVPQGLVGGGPFDGTKIAAKDRSSALILFDDHTILSVLPEYAKYLMEMFSREELAAGLFTAVAGVHTTEQTGNPPRFMGHYAPSYDPAISRKDPSPETFAQYILSGRRGVADRGETNILVTRIAAAILRLAQLAALNLSLARRASSHRYALELLGDKTAARDSYRRLIDHCVRVGGEITAADWNDQLKPLAAAISEAIAGEPATSSECVEFLKWGASSLDGDSIKAAATPDNLYHYPVDAPQVKIRLGSIHSVKGETHTATLVLDSFYHGHHLKELKPWLLGNKTGAGTGKKIEGIRMRRRLRLHYVAMTRPAHLLCLAMRRDALDDVEIGILRTRGRYILDCTKKDKMFSTT